MRTKGIIFGFEVHFDLGGVGLISAEKAGARQPIQRLLCNRLSPLDIEILFRLFVASSTFATFH